MRNARETVMNLGLVAVAAACLLPLSGCGKEEPPPPPPPKGPPPPPPVPPRVEISNVTRGIDARVQFPQEKAPYDESLANAVASFAGALASGDDAVLGDMLDLAGREILDSMLADGTWFDSTDQIEAVRVVYLGQTPDEETDADRGEFVLAVQQPGGAFTLGWEANETDGGWVMTPLETVGLTQPRAADWDADDFGAFQSERGWGGAAGASGGGFGAGGLGGMPALDESDFPMAAYLGSEVFKELMGEEAGPEMEQGFMQGLASSAGMSEDEARGMIDEGAAAVRGGERPSAEVVGLVVQSMMMVSSMSGQDWDEDRILSAMAGVLGISESEMREIADG